MSVEIRHIVFDIGKVLIHYDPDLPYKRIIPDDEERKWFFENVCTHDWNVEQDRGRTWLEAEALLLEKFPDREEHIRAFRKYWHEMVPHPYERSVAHLERLIAEGKDVTLLTNFADDTFDQALEIFPFLAKPRGVTVSARVRLIKPDAEIYRTHTEAFDLDPAHTLFIDDSLPNIEAARAFGWQAIHYVGADQLDSDLKTYGLA
ncbi:HAD family phosphatase [Rhizobium sp. KVB221]|uniref:HAD family phosphatase n=1 Tax=Rhizobium setariae TaxID=2801340 RepID=A0A936YIG6_9HYPH|nr:HAD family phosphatase [Rhizobium setariae]MBL0370874.1 HAD family phosphatase [Rhizobium setariae]